MIETRTKKREKRRNVMRLRIVTIAAMVLMFSAVGFSQNRPLTPQSRIQIAASQTHPISEIHVFTHANGNQRLEIVSPQATNVYGMLHAREGETGEQLINRMQGVANDMLRAQNAA